MIVISGLIVIHIILDLHRILHRWPMGDPVFLIDIVLGVSLIILLLEATRRTIGSLLTIIIIMFLLYTYFGKYVPGVFNHPGYPIGRIVDYMYLTLDGIYGIPIAASSTYVFLFVLFGEFLGKSGAGDFFIDFANALTGRARGGPAKVAVVSSAMFGMISGSPVSNVVTTGSFTIPMMKRMGYQNYFAGAVEAVASTGGAIMPPVMGIAAFLMAEVTGIPYKNICIAAIFPALLYYLSCGTQVHLRAIRLDLKGLTKEQLPSLKKTIINGFHFLIPPAALITLLMRGLDPTSTAFYSILVTILVSYRRKDTRMGIHEIIECLIGGAKIGTMVVVACGAAGMVVAGISLTGFGGKVAAGMIAYLGGNLFGAMMITGVVCIILGMGMPVAAAYILTAVLMTPAMIKLGVPLLSAHLFAVYYSVISAITPPVAVAAYAAAGLADANPNEVGWAATRLGLAGFVVPFMFVFEPALLLQGNILTLIWAVITASIGVISLAAGVEGWFFRDSTKIERIFFVIGGLNLVYPGLKTDLIGFACVAAGIVFQTKGWLWAKSREDKHSL